MIVAEIGQNWCGDEMLALELIGLAKANGADLVKFQLYDSKKLYGEYQNTELSFEQTKWLFNYGEELGIEVFFSVFDIERVKWCEEIGVKRYKIAHSQRFNEVLIAILPIDKPVIISADADRCHGSMGRGWVSTLYCVPKYPTEFKDLEFTQYENIFDDLFDGFSDHTIGLDASKIALARGAEIIEKHFCIDHNTGVDAPWSMNPEELKELKRWETVCKEAL